MPNKQLGFLLGELLIVVVALTTEGVLRSDTTLTAQYASVAEAQGAPAYSN